VSRAPLTSAEIERALAELPGWRVQGGSLVKHFQFKDFKAAFAFMSSIAKIADKMDHHPEWKNVYNRVEVELTTHDLGRKIGPNDVALAKAMEAYKA
jgi:4a-hydroxytetrahydrobiopterin dehydratase